jgi:hypothetical protein
MKCVSVTNHTICTSPTCWITYHHTPTSSTTLHRLNNFNSQDFNHHQFLIYIYITYIIVTEIVIILNCCGVTVTQLTTFVPLCILVIMTSPRRWPQEQPKCVGYLYIMDNILLFTFRQKGLTRCCVCVCARTRACVYFRCQQHAVKLLEILKISFPLKI